MSWLFLHIPHLLPAFLAFGMLVKFGQWALDSPPPHLDDAAVAEWRASRGERADAAPVRRRVAVLGLWALGPLTGALVTGLVIYSINLGHGRPGSSAIWLHVAVSVLALAVVVAKLAVVGRRGLRAGLHARNVWEAGTSLVLALTLVPLLITGIALLVW